MIKLGLENFFQKDFSRFKKQRLGILCNQASTNQNLGHITELLTQKKLGLKVTALFGPQHGIRGEKQYNMAETDDSIDKFTGLPVYSLYGKSREPSKESFDKIDTLLVDLQDVGCRVYTYIYTLANCMRAAKKWGKKIVVLDRPNPAGGVAIEGNILEPKFSSFVGQFAIPHRHGMTIGELAQLFNKQFEIGCDLEVIKMKGWKRTHFFDVPTNQWMPPSPNIPHFISAFVFTAGVFFEGTNVSEGRGTTRPFEWIGAPYIEPFQFAKEMNALKLEGIFFRPIFFQPTFNKWQGENCGGVHLQVTDFKKFNGFVVGTRLIEKIHQLYPNQFQWEKPPYEYEFEKMPIDLIVGTEEFRLLIDKNANLKPFFQRAKKDQSIFLKLRKPYLLY